MNKFQYYLPSVLIFVFILIFNIILKYIIEYPYNILIAILTIALSLKYLFKFQSTNFRKIEKNILNVVGNRLQPKSDFEMFYSFLKGKSSFSFEKFDLVLYEKKITELQIPVLTKKHFSIRIKNGVILTPKSSKEDSQKYINKYFRSTTLNEYHMFLIIIFIEKFRTLNFMKLKNDRLIIRIEKELYSYNNNKIKAFLNDVDDYINVINKELTAYSR